MNFTFGIITAGNNDEMINNIIDSIENEKIPEYEIIIVGYSKVSRSNCKTFLFDETLRPSWITRKKNIITEEARYENIVYLHDYIILQPGWYKGQLISGNDFHIRMDKIVDYDGERFRDWCLWVHNDNEMDTFIGRDALIPYDITHLSKYMYISGSYWIAKKQVMCEFPLNEGLSWGEGEDVLWSKEVRTKYEFNMNVNSTVKIMKQNKDRVFYVPSEEKIEKLKQWLG